MNNIYFDKLPETIAKSSNEDDVNTTEVRMWFKSDVKISPLSDRLAEERKKVVLDLKDKLLYCSERYIEKDNAFYYKADEVDEILHQIERENDETN